MLSFILGLIPGALNTVNGITNAISNQKIAAIKANTEEERIRAEENVKVLQARRDALIVSMQRSKFPIYVQGGLGVCGLVIIAKLAIWDKVIGSFMGCAGKAAQFLDGCSTFRTDPLGTDLSILVSAVIAFYLIATARSNK